MLPVAAGLIVGWLGALLLLGWLSGILYGISPRDPLVLATVPILLAAAALAALWLPARKAARLDPVEVLRTD